MTWLLQTVGHLSKSGESSFNVLGLSLKQLFFQKHRFG